MTRFTLAAASELDAAAALRALAAKASGDHTERAPEGFTALERAAMAHALAGVEEPSVVRSIEALIIMALESIEHRLAVVLDHTDGEVIGEAARDRAHHAACDVGARLLVVRQLVGALSQAGATFECAPGVQALVPIR